MAGESQAEWICYKGKLLNKYVHSAYDSPAGVKYHTADTPHAVVCDILLFTSNDQYNDKQIHANQIILNIIQMIVIESLK